MKYKLISKTTGEEHICDKVTIDRFDYYVSNETLNKEDWCIKNNFLNKVKRVDALSTIEDWIKAGWKKVIATNNLNIDIPKVVDEVDLWINETTSTLKDIHTIKTSKICLKAGYNKSQETHRYSAKDMVEFAEWIIRRDWKKLSIVFEKTTNELLQIWKEQHTKTLYYE